MISLVQPWGEAYGLAWPRGNGLNFLRVRPDGTPLGADLLIPLSNLSNSTPQLRWTGGGWAIVWRAWDNGLHYTFLAPDGTPLVLDTQLTTAVQADIAVAYHLIWTGLDLGLVWAELRDLDPPLDEIYFVRLNLDGSLAYPPVTALSTPQRDLNPLHYWTPGDSRFHLVHAPGGLVGIREIELQTDGAVLPGERWWTSRNLVSLAWNGVTLGYVVAAEGIQYFETGECVTGDATSPPCPTLGVASYNNLVRLDWDPVANSVRVSTVSPPDWRGHARRASGCGRRDAPGTCRPCSRRRLPRSSVARTIAAGTRRRGTIRTART